MNVYGRKLLLVDCDPFTQQYYAEKLGVDLGQPIDVEQAFGLTRPPAPALACPYPFPWTEAWSEDRADVGSLIL